MISRGGGSNRTQQGTNSNHINASSRDCERTFLLPLGGEEYSPQTRALGPSSSQSTRNEACRATFSKRLPHEDGVSSDIGPSRLYYINKRLAAIILICSFISPARAAIGGDDWANNLFSDLATIIALFGEQVAKQFLSDSSGIADSILFAMAPLGVITAIVSAIRVAGYPWLKAVVGRGKEAFAQAELELMSSNSPDVGEMYDGEAIVRVLGKPSVFQFVYAAEDGKREAVTPGTPSCSTTTGDEEQAHDQPTEPLLDEKKKFVHMIGTLNDRNYFFRPQHNGMLHEKPSRAPTFEWDENYDCNIPLLESRDGQAVQDGMNEDKSPPNMSLNARGKLTSTFEKRLMASIAVVAQLAVLVFEALISYHPSIKGHFLKGDLNPAKEAFTCTAVGTMALNFGMFICSYVIDRASIEETWVLREGLPKADIAKCSVCWIQKGETVNDQVFAPYLIFGHKSQKKIRTSHRNHKIEAELRFLVLLGTSISVVGFVTQFVGLRGMNWSATIAQLGATAFVTAIRSLIRRRMTQEPHALKAVEGYELDCMARRITQCSGWKVVSAIPENEKLDDLCHRTLEVRTRLVELSQWSSDTVELSGILCSAMEKTLNLLYESKEVAWAGDVKTRCRFRWDLPVKAYLIDGDNIPHYGQLCFELSRPDQRGVWKAGKETVASLTSILSLWRLRFAEEETHHRTRGRGIMPETQDLGDIHSAARLLSWPRHTADQGLFNLWMGSHDLDITSRRLDSVNQDTKIPMHRFVGRLEPVVSGVSPTDRTIVVFPAASIKRLFAQEIFSIYFSAILSHVQDILGAVECVPHENRVDIAGFRHSTLSQLVDIVSETGLGNRQEIHLMLVTALGERGILPLASDNAIGTMAHCRLERSLRHSASGTDWNIGYTSGIIRLAESNLMGGNAVGTMEMVSAERFVKQFWIRILFIERQHMRLLYADFIKFPYIHHAELSFPVLATRGVAGRGGVEVLVEFFSSRVRWFHKWWEALVGWCREKERQIDPPLVQESPEVVDYLAFLEAPGAKDMPEYDLVVEALPQVIQTWTYESLNDLLRLAVSRGQHHVIQVLSSHIYTYFPNEYRQMRHREIPMFVFEAVLSGHVDTVRLLIMQTHKHEISYYRQAAFIYAAGAGVLEVARKLFAEGASINQRRSIPRQESTGIIKISSSSKIELWRLGAIFREKEFRVGGSYTGLLQSAHSRSRNHYEVAIEHSLANRDPQEVAAEISMRSALEAAAAGGHEEVVKWLLRNGAEANSAPHRGPIWSSALQHAAGNGNLSIVKQLLDVGAEINRPAYGCFGRTALQAAAEGGHLEVVMCLLDRGADLNAPPASFGGRTALQAAAEGGHTMVVEELLDHEDYAGAQAAAAPIFGLTAIQAAAIGGDPFLLDLLIENYMYMSEKSSSCSIDGPDKASAVGSEDIVNEEPAEISGRTALQAAAQAGNIDIIGRLLELGADVNAQPSQRLGLTALQSAALGGHFLILKRLIEAGASVNAPPAVIEGLTALQAASSIGHLEIVNHLIGLQAHVSICTGDITALECAADGGHEVVLQHLLDYVVRSRSNVYRIQRAVGAAARRSHLGVVMLLMRLPMMLDHNENGSTLRITLLSAVESGCLEIIELLLSSPTPSDGVESVLKTALKEASFRGHSKVVMRLLDYIGSALTAEDVGTALAKAMSGGHLDIVGELFRRGASYVHEIPKEYMGQALHAAAERGHLEMTILFLDLGAPINVGLDGFSGQTSLLAAAGSGHLPVVEHLLAAGVEVNAIMDGMNAQTALQAAAESGHLSVVEYLLSVGADVNLRSRAAVPTSWDSIMESNLDFKYDGRGPLQEVTEFGHLRAGEILLTAHADDTSFGRSEGPTALQAAVGGGHVHVVERLLAAGAEISDDLNFKSDLLDAAKSSGSQEMMDRVQAAIKSAEVKKRLPSIGGVLS